MHMGIAREGGKGLVSVMQATPAQITDSMT